MSSKKQKKHVGSSLDDILKEEGILQEARAIAIKEALRRQVQQAMTKGDAYANCSRNRISPE